MTRKGRLITLGIVAVLAGAVTLFVVDAYWPRQRATQAIDRALGPTEKAMAEASTSHCPLGAKTYAFIAQGSKVDREVQGYVCASWWGETQVREQRLDERDHLDWD